MIDHSECYLFLQLGHERELQPGPLRSGYREKSMEKKGLTLTQRFAIDGWRNYNVWEGGRVQIPVVAQ